MMPKSTSGPTIQIGASTASEPSVCSGPRCQPGVERDGDAGVDDAAAVGEHLDALAADLDDHGDVADRHAREAAPTADALLAAPAAALRRLVGRDGPAEEHSAEHAHPFGRSVARVRDDRRDVPAPARPALADVVDPVLEARGTVPDLALHGSGRGGGLAGIHSVCHAAPRGRKTRRPYWWDRGRAPR